MTLQLTQKEQQLLQDQKKHEKVCVEKYNEYAEKAGDPQLKQLFRSYAQQEQQHMDTVAAMLNGQAPSMSQGQSQQGQQGQPSQAGRQGQPQGGAQSQAGLQSTATAGGASQADAMLCQDMLMTEKYVSGAYDTAIFEFADANVRQTLNHIQKEEQQHGEGLYNYLSSAGMYNTQ